MKPTHDIGPLIWGQKTSGWAENTDQNSQTGIRLACPPAPHTSVGLYSALILKRQFTTSSYLEKNNRMLFERLIPQGVSVHVTDLPRWK